jgi:hypothetical protein
MSGVWVLLAWTVAGCQLRAPVMRHEVFGVETIAAFVVFVSMPLMYAGRIAGAARGAVAALRSCGRYGQRIKET